MIRGNAVDADYVQLSVKKAITMKMDNMGFIYPEIDGNLCIECGKCVKICSYNNQEKFYTPIECYAALAKNKDVLSKSASGGIFATIANQFIESGDGSVELSWILKMDELFAIIW